MDIEDLKNRFTYHPPFSDIRVEKHMEAREQLLKCAEALNAICVSSRELSLAITHLEEAMFWANAAIARHEDPEYHE